MDGFIYLALAILFEVAGTTALKLSEGFTKLFPSILMVVLYVVSFGLLSLTLKKMDVGVAYAIWAAVGTALIALIGVIWFNEPLTLLKIAAIGFIIIGVVMLNLAGGVH
ncbi:MAG: multidrug efflux SMR transporter [Chloroflexi bacterium]|nr:multidrug efflux SMR transporter [Chloroflexota bacterium]